MKPIARQSSASLTLQSADETAAVAQLVAPMLKAGDVILLVGPVGAGKTHFARSVIQARLAAAGQAEDVPSPTFTLVQIYEAGALEIWHADLYRLTQPDEATELGLLDAFETAVCLIEWPEKLADLAPDAALTLTLTPMADEDARQITLSARNPRWAEVFKALAKADRANV
jgi:tRNA threonylcarbamoyladenosine biosynthesis protein TsaE